MAQGYVKSLDGLRGVAILMMMSYHANILPFAWVSMQLFFVLSGFLIISILWSDKFKPESNSFKFKKFWVRRSLRILPLYMAWLVVLGLTYLLFNFPAYYYDNIPYLATYTFNYTRSFEGWEGNPLFTHLWSLSVEEQFYLFLPPLVFFLPVKWLKAFMVVMVVLAPVARYLIAAFHLSNGMHPEAAADAVYWNTLSHLDAFSLGGIIAVFSLHRKWKRPGLLLTIVLMIVMAAGALNFINAGTGFYFTDLGYRHNQTVHYEYVWHYSLLNLLFATVILYLTSIHVQQKNLLQKILGFNWLVRVGKVSYGMYIFHWAVLVYVFNKLVPPTSIWMKAVTFIPYSITVYLLAEVSFRLFETPFLKLKDALFPSKPLQNNVKAEVATPTAP